MSALNNLIDHWRLFENVNTEHVHRRDAAFFTGQSDKLHLFLPPIPYVGDLKSADVWILMLNSGVGACDEQDEAAEPYHSLKSRNLRQEFADVSHPFISLDPALSDTGTYLYYNQKRGLGRLISSLAAELRLTKENARALVARKVAVLELIPYRSKGFPGALAQVPSANLARAAAHEALGQKLLVSPWGAAHWRLPAQHSDADRLITRSARAFSFAPGGASGFGEAIIKRLIASCT